VSFQNANSNFVVNDRPKLEEVFKDHIGFFDFTLEEVRQLAPFLKALGLENNYLSHVTTEETACTENKLCDANLTQSFKNKSYGLLR